MISSVSKTQIFYSNKDNLTKGDSFHATEGLDSDKNYDEMLFNIQNPITESGPLTTSEESKCSIDDIENISTLAWACSRVISSFAENVESLLYEKQNLDKYDNFVLHLTQKLLNISKSAKPFTNLIKNSFSLENSPKFSGALSHLRQDISCEEFLKKKLYPIWKEMLDWNASSNILTKEIIFNTHFANRRRRQTMQMRKLKSHDWLNELSNVTKDNFIEKPSAPALDFSNRDNNENQKLNLLCVFTNKTDYEETSLDFNKMLHDEDVRMILPMTWNIVVAYNVLTISDENNQHITIFFRNPLKARFDYKYSNLSSGKKFKFNSLMDVTYRLKDRNQSSRMKKLNSPYKETTVIKQQTEPFICRNSKIVYKSSPKQFMGKRINDSFLLLREPILFNCIEQNKTKQVLMYKAHSVENKNNFSKTLQNLLNKSIQYEDEPVHLVFEPLKLITRLKKEEKIRDLNQSNHSKCKHRLIRSSIYKKLLQYKNTQMLMKVRYENEIFGSESECTLKKRDKSGLSNESVIAIQLSKNSSSVARQLFNMNDCTIQEKNISEMSDETIINTLDLPKNFSAFVLRRDFDMDELFEEKKLKFHRRMSRTALKQINANRVVSSVFRHFFHFYSLLGGNLRSGAVITRSGSNYWLQVAGVATDSYSLRLAGDLFTTVAGKKLVLNIFDYIKFLIVFARTRRLIITELVKQMMVCEQLSDSTFSKEKCKKCISLKNRESEPAEYFYEQNHLPISQSLPNIWPTKANSIVENRSCLTQEIF